MSKDDEEEMREVLDEIREHLDDEADLVPTDPREAYDLWLQQQHSKNAESTVNTYKRRIRPFLQFLTEESIEDLNDLTSRKIKEYEADRRSRDLDPQTLNNRFGTIRQFLQYCATLDAVTEDAAKALDVPSLSKEDRVNTEKLISERSEEILEKLDQYRYASNEHVTLLLLWRTTIRIGTLRSLDLDDLYLDEDDVERLRTELLEAGHQQKVTKAILEEARVPFIFPRHRPESGTGLKNEESGERVINITEETAEVLQSYIRVNRLNVTDDTGREPLLPSRKGNGRLSRSWVRNTIYILTQPCEFGDPCPHDRDPETCEAREHGYGSKCPSSRSPHKLRTGSITWHRDRGWPVSAVAEKANTSEELVEGVYDQPEALTRGAARRHHLDKLDGEER